MMHTTALRPPCPLLTRAMAFRLAWGLAVSLLGFTPTLSVRAAAPKLTHLIPAGGQQGTSVTVRFGGALADTDHIWCSDERMDWSVAEDAKTLQVQIPDETPAGLYWIRAWNAEGASPLRPFVVGTLPEVLETEPNDRLEQAPVLEAVSQIVNGQLHKSGEVDVVAIPLTAGQTVVCALSASHQLGSPMDSVLQLLSPSGAVLLQNDDDQGMDSQIVYDVSESGVHYVRLFAFPATPNSSIRFAGGEDYVYRLTLSTGAFVDHTLPMTVAAGQTTQVELFGWNLDPESRVLDVVAPDLDSADATSVVLSHPRLDNWRQLPVSASEVFVETPEAARAPGQSLSVPGNVSGCIAQSGEIDWYRFTATKGDKLKLACLAREYGSQLDPLIVVRDADGKVLKESDDIQRGDLDARTEFPVPTDGEFRISVRDRFESGSFRHAYLLSLVPVAPDVALSVEKNAYTLEAGDTLEFDVTVSRQNGFAEELIIGLDAVPEGITCEPVASSAEGETAKKVKLVLTAAVDAAFHGPVTVVGRFGESLRRATAPIANHSHTTSSLWLTVRSSEDKPED